MTVFDFDFQFVKYASYHHNSVNKFIHILFVPCIVWTGLVMLPRQISFWITVCYSIYYMILWPLVGVLCAPILFSLYYTAALFGQQSFMGYSPAIIAILVHMTSWICQLLGHALFEKRSPALINDPLQGNF